MKILFLQDNFLPEDFSGPTIVVFNLARELRKLGHQIFIIATGETGRTKYRELEIFKIKSGYHERWRAYLSLYNPQTVKKVEQLIKEIRPDIIHAHNIYQLSYHSLKIAKRYCPVFLTAHDVMSFHYGKLIEFINPDDLSIPDNFDYRISPWQQIKRFKKRYNPLRNIIIKHYLKYIDKIFAVSYALKEALRQNGVKNVEVIYNSIDVDNWPVQDSNNFKKKYNLLNKKSILLIGRLSGLKGGEKIIKAMALVAKQVPKSILLVAGDENDYARRMRQMADNLSVPLIFTGRLPRDQVKLAYQSSELVVAPSICFDSFPTINLEAMASKKPVIGSCFGGSSEIIQNGLTGYIVNPFNINDLAEKIMDLLNNPEKAKQFGKNGFRRVRNEFFIKNQINKTLKWYQITLK